MGLVSEGVLFSVRDSENNSRAGLSQNTPCCKKTKTKGR